MSEDVRNLARARWRVAVVLSVIVFALYFGFIFAVAFAKDHPLGQRAVGQADTRKRARDERAQRGPERMWRRACPLSGWQGS